MGILRSRLPVAAKIALATMMGRSHSVRRRQTPIEHHEPQMHFVASSLVQCLDRTAKYRLYNLLYMSQFKLLAIES